MKFNLQSTTVRLLLAITLIVNFACSKTETGDEHCPEGYSGKNCDEQITPDSIYITKIKVNRFPATNLLGHNWDTTDNADIFVEVWQNNEDIWSSEVVFENAANNITYTFIPTDTLALTDHMAQYAIHLFDKDESTADHMGGINFISYAHNNGFPELFTLYDGGEVEFELTLEYSWKK